MIRARRITLGIALTAAAATGLGAPTAARAQGQGPGPQKFQNLQFFPKDIPRDTLLMIMRGFTDALGVRCQYCHVSEAGANGQERFNFASDDKETKKKARFMLHMVDTI